MSAGIPEIALTSDQTDLIVEQTRPSVDVEVFESEGDFCEEVIEKETLKSPFFVSPDEEEHQIDGHQNVEENATEQFEVGLEGVGVVDPGESELDGVLHEGVLEAVLNYDPDNIGNNRKNQIECEDYDRFTFHVFLLSGHLIVYF